MSKNIPSTLLEDQVFQRDLQKIMRGYAGIYALYRGKNLYYVGLTQDLYWRVQRHLADRHRRKWDRFKIFRIQKVAYLKDIETLVHNVIETQGNRQIGKVPKDADLNHALRRTMSEYERKVRMMKRTLR